MSVLVTLRNLSIGFAIMILLPTIAYVGTRVAVKEVAYPRHTPIQAKFGAPITQTKTDSEYQAELAAYNESRSNFQKAYFYTSGIIGLLALILGAFVIPIPFLSLGFIMGGTFCLIGSYFMYWDILNNIIKLISLILALILLIIGGIRLARTEKETTTRRK
ncbi:MAG TPA: hypothetical protein VJJ81_03585 [Candidatus Babeliales bacterium]|nr:hypothetical protein [Candidatus Babeliales bacterium]